VAGRSATAAAESHVDLGPAVRAEPKVRADRGSAEGTGRRTRGARRIDQLAAGRSPAGLRVVEFPSPSRDRGEPDQSSKIERVVARLGGVVRPASEHAAASLGAERMLPVLPELRALLPGGGLRRGSTVAVCGPGPLEPGRSQLRKPGRQVKPEPGLERCSSSVLLALLAAASGAGSWCGVVGMPALSPTAAAEMGVVLDRLVFVPHPGTEWTTAVAALLDGLDIVVAAPPGPIAPAVAGRLAARARQRGSVFVPVGSWAGADLTIEAVADRWQGLGAGRGRLRARELTVRAHGRGAASAPREVTIRLPRPAVPAPELIDPDYLEDVAV
jgi:hypothetical protein